LEVKINLAHRYQRTYLSKQTSPSKKPQHTRVSQRNNQKHTNKQHSSSLCQLVSIMFQNAQLLSRPIQVSIPALYTADILATNNVKTIQNHHKHSFSLLFRDDFPSVCVESYRYKSSISTSKPPP